MIESENDNIDRILFLINWNRSISEQQAGISLARELLFLKPFFRPTGRYGGKGVWENCALILCERSDTELEPYIMEMLLWLEDLNWRGAELIQARLIQFQKVTALADGLNNLVPQLSELGKKAWIEFLSELLTNPLLPTALNSNTVEILQSNYPR